jgi:hypothetical protein
VFDSILMDRGGATRDPFAGSFVEWQAKELRSIELNSRQIITALGGVVEFVKTFVLLWS